MGTLYVCGTPIGNLEDISLRVLRILREADCIAAEDTRHTLKLLNFYNITTPLTSYHEHNAHEKGPDLLRQLKQDRNIALVSDAGMPCISDPGQALVKRCVENNVEVRVIPGATAAVSALCLSGFETNRFCFEGFLDSVSIVRSLLAVEMGVYVPGATLTIPPAGAASMAA